MRRSLLATAALCALAAAASAQPAPIAEIRSSFPGAFTHPASGASAALGLADRWLGDGPYDNPAVAPANQVVLGGALYHPSRQDLRRNRRFDGTAAYFDAAGGELRAGWRGFAASFYAHQPVLRLEDAAYVTGDPLLAPRAQRTSDQQRELLAGLALSYGRGAWRGGAAVEYTRRDDRFEREETSGSPDAGLTTLSYSGGAVGFQLGARGHLGPAARGGLDLGAAFRSVPALDVDGTQQAELLSGSSLTDVAASRGGSWEAGVSLRYAVTDAFRALVGLGAHGEQDWASGASSPPGAFAGMRRGEGASWALAGEYHDARDPWVARAGGGMEQQSGVAESRAGVIAVGFGWIIETTRLDVGVLHRSLRRAGQPLSYEDRIAGSVTQSF